MHVPLYSSWSVLSSELQWTANSLEDSNLRRQIVRIASLVFGCLLPLSAQTPATHPPPGHPPHGLAQILGLDQHAAPAQAGTKGTPTVYLDASSMGSPIQLDHGWRVGITARQEAAQPDFDDSTWAIRNADGPIADVPDEDHIADTSKKDWDKQGNYVGPTDTQSTDRPHQRPWVWFRLHVRLAPNHGPVALLVELPVSQSATVSFNGTGPVADVFANGKQIMPEGPHGDAPEHYQQISRIYTLNIPDSQTDFVLVLRTLYIPFGFGAYTSFFTDNQLRLGRPNDLGTRLEIWNTRALFERLPRIVNGILLLVLSLFLLALYFTQKGHLEYLLLALHEFVQAPLGFVELAGSTARLDTLWYVATVMQLVAISAFLYFEFLVRFLEIKRRWHINLLRYTSPILLAVGPVLLLVGHGDWAGITLIAVWGLAFFWISGWVIFIFATLIRATLRKNFEAGLLLIPLILDMIGVVEPILTGGMSQWSGHPYRSPLTVLAGPIPIHFASFADFIGILSIVIIIFIRFLRIQHDQERANGELAAARSVQELMIPNERLETPGFEVDSVYNPANEVGGDFFYLEPTSDGGLLVVLGDVAGKGLKAAMSVSMLMGALRRIGEKSPARILEALNHVVAGTDGLTTCQAALFHPDGELVMANAGHLPPYLNSQEVNLPGGLPLGALENNSYVEMRLYLHPGDRILLLSDGVVEARTNEGELFGFDRVHNLSNQTAFYIADAAREFGQEDDITVLTVRRLAQAAVA